VVGRLEHAVEAWREANGELVAVEAPAGRVDDDAARIAGEARWGHRDQVIRRGLFLGVGTAVAREGDAGQLHHAARGVGRDREAPVVVRDRDRHASGPRLAIAARGAVVFDRRLELDAVVLVHLLVGAAVGRGGVGASTDLAAGYAEREEREERGGNDV